MTIVLNALLEMTVFSVVLFTAILLFQRLFRRRISAAMSYAIWALLILRLLMPITVESGFHVFTVPQQQAVQTAYADATSDMNNIEIPSVSSPASQLPKKHTAITQPAETIDSATKHTSQTTTISEPLDWSAIVVLIWAIGALGFFTYTANQRIRLSRKMKRSGTDAPAFINDMINACKKDLGIRADIKVSVQDWLISPALSASLKPTLLLPKSMLEKADTQALAFGIRHELTHFKRRDHVMSLLLMALRCVHWFNPVVWFAFRRIQADMETACDAAVTARMTGYERTRYIHTMIDMGSGAKPLYALGMGCGQGRKALEKRVRGIFMTKRTKPAVRMAAGLLALLLFVACFTTACQPTPEEPIVIGKGDGLGDLIQATPSASSNASPSESTQDNDALYTKLGAPKHWNLETTALADKLNITADVDIELPGVSQLPAATASLSEFTQEDLDKIANVLGVKGSEWTKIINVPTKEQIEQWIIDDEEEIANSDDAFRVEKAKDNLEAHEQLYKDAPYESELKKTLTEFEMSEEEFYEGTTGVRFEGTTMIDGQPFYLYAGNIFGKSVRTVRANFGSRPAGFWGTYIDKPYGISLTKEQAADQASEIAKQLTNELTLCYVVPTGGQKQEDMSRNWGWACVFMREINGCPTAYESTDVGSDMETTVSEPVPYEKMVIVMDDMGMVSFKWETPMTIKSIDNPDVTLLPFDEISKRAAAQIGQRWAYNAIEAKSNEGKDMSDPGCTAIITKVELGLMRVAKADSDDYYYIPVWNFFTDFEHTDDYWERIGEEPFSWEDHDYVDEQGNSTSMVSSYPQAWGAVTINALDGSVINRDLGY